MTLRATIAWLGIALAVFAIGCAITLSATARDFVSEAALTYPYIAVWGASALAASFLCVRAIVLVLRLARKKQK